MSEMVERVAKAIEAARDDDLPDALEMARAAIAAMREPTEAMLAAVYGQSGETNGSDDTAQRLWQSMIDAA